MTIFEKVSRERDLWKTALRRELEGSYSPAESKRRIHKHQQYIDQEVERERTSGKSVEAKVVGDGTTYPESVESDKEDI